MDLTRAMNSTRVKQNSLSCSRFTGINVRNDADVPRLCEVLQYAFDFVGCGATHDQYVIPNASRPSPPGM
jgi:hypothetical protein